MSHSSVYEYDRSAESSEPEYVVQFWTEPAGLAPQLDSWIVDDIADVAGVLDWAVERSEGRTFVVYVRDVTEAAGPLIRIHGQTPVGGTIVTIEFTPNA